MMHVILVALTVVCAFVLASVAEYVALKLGYPVASPTDLSASDISVFVWIITAFSALVIVGIIQRPK